MIIQYIKKRLPNQPCENDTGNREYKLYLCFSDPLHQPIKKTGKQSNGLKFKRIATMSEKEKFDRRITQLYYRLSMGDGKAIYIIGIYDNGETSGVYYDVLIASLIYIIEMAMTSNVIITSIRIYKGQQSHTYLATVRLKCNVNHTITSSNTSFPLF